MPYPLTPQEQQAVFSQLRAEQARIDQFAAQATPELAQRVGDIYRGNRNLPGGVVLAAAQAGFTDEQIKPMADASAGVAPEKKKNWFQRNVADKVKTATRFGFAALDFPLQTLQGAAAQVFSPNDADGIEGWFASTDLGSLIKNDEEAGDGYFLGGKSKQLQTQRVQNYRGKTEGGHAWTIGRGMAGVMFDEGSKPYALLSGIADGLIAVGLPVAPGFKPLAGAVKTAAAADDASDIFRGADYAFDLMRGRGGRIGSSTISGEDFDALAKQMGLSGQVVDMPSVNKWYGSRQASWVQEHLAGLNTADEVRRFIGKNVHPSTVKALRDAKTVDEVSRALIDVLGIPQLGIVSKKMPGTKIFGMSNARRVKVVDNLVGAFEDTRAGRITVRAFERRPMHNVVDFSSESEIDVARSLNDIDRWAKGSLINDDDRVQFLDRALDAMIGPSATPTARKALRDEAKRLIHKSWTDAGVPDHVATAIMNEHNTHLVMAKTYGANIDKHLSGGAVYTGRKMENVIFGDALMQSEFADAMIEFPDIRQVRGLTGRYNRIWRKKPGAEALDFADENIKRLSEAGRLRFPVAAAQHFQEDIFRKLVTATGGFGIRNVLEGQIGSTLSNLSRTSIVRHPFEHILWAANRPLKFFGRKGVGDLSGETWQSLATKAGDAYGHAVDAAITSHYKDPKVVLDLGKRSGHVVTVSKATGERVHVIEAHGDQIGLMNADAVMREIADGKNFTDQQLLSFIRTDDAGKKWFVAQQDRHMNGIPVLSKATGEWEIKKIDLRDQHNLRQLIHRYRQRYAVTVGNHPELRSVVREGHLPGETIDAYKIGLDSSHRGQILDIPQAGNPKNVRRVRIDMNDENLVYPFAFTGTGENTPAMKKLLGENRIYDDPSLANEFAWEPRVSPATVKDSQMQKGFDAITDRIYGTFNRRPVAYLERSPAFKQRFYTWADEMITSLSKADLDKSILQITERATIAGVTPSQYVGDSEGLVSAFGRLFGKPSRVGDRWQRMLDLQADPTKLKGTLTLDEVNEFAKGQALDDLKKFTYDASERNNLTDVARAVMPFGQAQAEFLRRMFRVYTVETGMLPLPNIAAIRKTQVGIQGAFHGDPDGDGRGFVYDDPQTGEKVFDYPLSGELNEILTRILPGMNGPGVNATFQAPLKGALLGLQVQPGLGPVAQIAVSKWLPDVPATDFAKRMLLPYGEIDMGDGKGLVGAVVNSVTPAWFKKFQSAFFDKPESATAYGNTFMETYQALAASKAYDLTTQIGMDGLYQDTIMKAKYLTVMRSLGQFMGPSRPTPKMEVETLQGDVMVNVLSQELRTMQLEDYDSAIPRFLDIYGEDVFVYLSGKTRAVYGGLQASRQFGDFERAHPGLFRKYKDVAGYFTEGGTDLDWQVYTRQLENGRRKRLTPQETLEAAQRYVAYSKYRQVQDLVGTHPNREQREYLSRYRDYLGELYPGFAATQFDPNKLGNDIDQLVEAVADPSLADNDVASAARLYLQTRTTVLAEATRRGLSGIDRSKNARDLREYLRSYGKVLKEQYPNFARLYDRLLLQEIDE